ncbi:hypothetical protein ACFXQA_10750 [Microbacterium sp. P07]|uniref:hypothetical protein n=1 Tax=Microbacterium sp. P07 TaxID=3366952 RepID=UPI0037473417
MTRRARPIGTLATLALAAVLTLTGCSPAPEEAWRDQVSQAAMQASAGDYPGATATLLSVEQDVTAARDGNLIDRARADEILAAAAIVRADLETLSTPTPVDTPAPVDTAAPVAPSTPPGTGVTDGSSEDDEDEEPGGGDDKGNSGNDKGNNGNGNSKKDDE